MKRKLLCEAVCICRLDTLYRYLTRSERREAVAYCYTILSIGAGDFVSSQLKEQK